MEHIDLSVLPDNARTELYDFYLFLKQRYGKEEQPTPKRQARLERLKKLKVDSFVPLSRDEIYER